MLKPIHLKLCPALVRQADLIARANGLSRTALVTLALRQIVTNPRLALELTHAQHSLYKAGDDHTDVPHNEG